MPTPSIWVRYCGKALMRASKRRQSYLSRQWATSAWAFWRGTPCDQSPTVSRPGHRVDASRRLRSSSAACGTWTLKGVTSFVAAGSTICAAVSLLPRALSTASSVDNIPAPPVATAAPMNLRREVRGTGTPVLFSKSSFMWIFVIPPVSANVKYHDHEHVTASGRSLTSPRTKGLPQLLGEELWLLERGEVPALVDLIPIEQVGPQSFSPGLGWAADLLRKDRRRHRQLVTS